MASTYSTNLAIELIGTGDQAGTWGTTTNSNLGTLIEQSISGYVTQAVSTGTDTTITIPNGSTGVARNMYIELTGTGGSNTNLVVPANKKLYFIFNNSTGAVTVKVSAQTGVSVPTGKKMVLVSNGTDIVNGLNYIADFATNSFTVTNLTASSGTITNLIATSGSITNLVSSDASATVLRAGSATLTHLSATSATITNLTLTSLVISNLSIASANITTLTSASATITNLLATSLAVSSIATFAAGSAAAPSITTTGDTNTGIFFPAADTIGFSEGGVEAARFDSSGNLGIGTASPGGKLDVKQTTDTSLGGIYVRATNNNAAVISRLTTGNLVVRNGGIDSLFLDSSGNLGLGVTPSGWTSSPAFQIGPGFAAWSTAVTNARIFANTYYDGAYKYVGTGRATQYEQDGYHAWYTSASGTAGNTITFTQAMTLDASGNLGIGTSSPGQKLEVAGNILVNTSGNPYAEIKTSGSGNNPALKLTADTNSWTFQGTFSNTYDDLLVMYNATTVLGVNNLGNFQLAATLTGNGHLYFTNSADGGTQGYIGDAKSLISGAANSTLGVRGESGILFGIGATERARITSGGTLLVGTTTGAYTGAGCINSEVSSVNDFCFSGVNTNATNPRGLYLRNTNTTAGDYAIYFEASAVTKFYVNGNGVIHSTNTSVQSISDARHKENVRDLDKGLVEVLALKPRRFDWKEGKGTGAKDVAGFIAQEVEAVLPELVGEWKESIDAKEKFKSIGMANVIPMLVKAIQEQQAIITALTARLTTLESK